MTIGGFVTFYLFLIVVLSLSIALYINYVQPKPYMDEVFHVPQAQQYCNGNFSSWDPMITTLPGTYLASVGVLYPVSLATEQPLIRLCTTGILRNINIIFTTANSYLLLCIYTTLHPQVGAVRSAATAMTLTTFPVMYFFTFLYYTDPGAIFCVLMMYYFHLRGYRLVAAVMGTVAILFRQTNIIWVVFLAGLSTQECINNWMALEKKDHKTQQHSDYRTLSVFFSLVFSNLRRKHSMVLELVWRIFMSAFWYVCVGVGFAAFVYLNDGIVVGDRSHHQACLNVPQLFYFLSVSLIFGAPHFISVQKILKFVKFSFQNFVYVPVFCVTAFVLIYNFTYVHEYLLSDNRHYVFYVWSKIFRRHEYVKYALIPLYFYAAYQINESLNHRDVFWRIVYVICLLGSTVPQKLMEFRYFIIPYLILRLNMASDSLISVSLEFILYTIINVATLYMFGKRPFKWQNSDDLQRFMW